MDQPTTECNILIVNDDPMESRLLEMQLRAEGHVTSIAANGEEGLTLAAHLHPDAVILDVIMPGMSGFDVCRELRADSALSEIYIMMVTSLADRESRLEGFEAGADDFLSKPVDALELRARLRNVARLNRYRSLSEEREKNMILLSDLHMAYDATLEGWVRALDLRDHETEGHTKRVADLTVHLARAMHISGEDQEHFHRGALLHDIGKIGVPDGILHKSGPLMPEERLTMQHHPTYAHEMLSEIDYLLPALDIPWCHHERWDGTGYPRGLKGDDIPIAARIFPVVDVWDALSSVRPYKDAWSQDKVMSYLNDESGKMFDPAVVDAFCWMMAERGGILVDTLTSISLSGTQEPDPEA
jgi:putative two-component system response regulator